VARFAGRIGAQRVHARLGKTTVSSPIRRNDGEVLFEHFSRTRAIRRGIVEIGQDSAAPDFGRPHANLTKRPE
jgi:hypothetical protein